MENKKSTEAKGDTIMNKEEFAALWKSIRLKVTDTYDVPPEILWERLRRLRLLSSFYSFHPIRGTSERDSVPRSPEAQRAGSCSARPVLRLLLPGCP